MHGKPRSSFYITTKVTAGCGSDIKDCSDDPNVALASVNQSLRNLGVDYIDMILLHRYAHVPCAKAFVRARVA